MALNVTVGDLRAKSKTAATGGQMYAGDIPILVAGTERGVIHVGIFIPDAMSAAEANELLGSGLSVTFNTGSAG